MSAIAFVPVRGGSKGIAGKNIKSFCGKPLVYWCLKAVEHAESIDQCVVATDSDEIEKVVQSFGFSKVQIYRRSAVNATDTSSTESVMLEYLERGNLYSSDLFILVQATSPFTQSSDFEEAIKKLSAGESGSLITCARMKRFFWNDNGTPINYDFANRPRRQDFGGTLIENGAFYINTVQNIQRDKNRLSGDICVFEMPEYTLLELDEPTDWILGESLMAKHNLITTSQKEIKLFLSDIDGVLTDAGMYYTENGDEIKRFSTYDGMAFKLLKEAGILTGLVTSEDRQLNKKRAEKLKLDYLYQGAKDKLQLVSKLCEELGISLSQVAYIGDDINDLELLKHVGLAATPKNGRNAIKAIPNIIHLETSGGSGAVREFAELILNKTY